MREARIKRLTYQSWYRGCKETDRLIGWFCKLHLHDMSDAGLDEMEQILEVDDKHLFNWLTQKEPTPEPYASMAVMQELLAFDVSPYLT